jgi:hypothetical protein
MLSRIYVVTYMPRARSFMRGTDVVTDADVSRSYHRASNFCDLLLKSLNDFLFRQKVEHELKVAVIFRISSILCFYRTVCTHSLYDAGLASSAAGGACSRLSRL